MTGAVGFVRNGGHDRPPTTSSLFCGTPIHQTHSFRPTQQASTQQAQSDSSPYTQEIPHTGRNKSSRARVREDPYTQPTRHGLQDKLTLTDGARVARRRRDAHVIMVAGACCCESLWLGGCMGGRRNVEETNKEEALVGFCLCPCADCEPDHGLPSLWAAFRRTGSWPGRSCRGWAVLCWW
jgi:hypothetical protein